MIVRCELWARLSAAYILSSVGRAGNLKKIEISSMVFTGVRSEPHTIILQVEII
jgi:hypothetical protein